MFHHDVFIAHRNNLAVILTHLDETKTHVQRVEQVFQMLGAQAKAVDCPAIDGIIKEANEIAGEVADNAVLDAALINAAQAAEHYEIARYGSLVAWAKQLGRNDCASRPIHSDCRVEVLEFDTGIGG